MNDIDQQAADIRGDRGSNQSGGASIEYSDKRVTGAVRWLWSSMGAAAVAGIYWAASSINTLNVNLERALVRMDYQDKRQDLTEVQIRQLQRDVAEMQGKVYRSDGSIKAFPNER